MSKKYKPICEFRPILMNDAGEQTETLISVYPEKNEITRIFVNGGCAFFDIKLTKQEKKLLISSLKNEE